ncbi:MAG TPA: tRNA uridine-5-carboxymethylaminomethyl(34) synthesis GTPase MnmE [Gemmatimonadales bacterium]|nr:tRNA uridine-5-carboxymethylaminomethyl(34) synthesis GTPase MnmE [Gemmatimonadales bacterium]
MLSDPIAALATPAGRSALAVIRLSGTGVFEIAARVIAGFTAGMPRTAVLATFRDADGQPIDRGLYTTFPKPHSYTGEDLVELSCHGGLLVPARLLAALHAAGARPAAPGEFTRRAVLNGKLDLVQAEAVGDLIDATAPVQARVALAQLDGGLSRRLAELRESLVEAGGLLAYEIDFPGEDDGPIPPERIVSQLADVAGRIERLLATAPAAERLREGALLVLAGRPNAGKSSLFNALLGTDRALVTEIPGTTRDAVEAHTDFLGWPIRLVDTAGLWEATDRIDRLGVEMSRRYLGSADLVLLCVEAGRPVEPDETAIADALPALVVRTKLDLDGRTAGEAIGVSAVTGAGLDRLRRAAAERVFAERIALADLEPALTRERHRTALARAQVALAGALEQMGGSGAGSGGGAAVGDAVLAAHHVREAATALDELVGAVDVEEVLDRVFASFCVGK